MNAIVILMLSAATIIIGYGFYAKRIDRTIIQPDEKKPTPAKMFMDGVDYTPANRNVLFGYQFKSIAALGPITGPIVAVKFGWLPALLWILLGTLFLGWVQDYGSIIVPMQEEGKSFGALSYQLISPRARILLIYFIYFYLWLIMGAFGNLIGMSLMKQPHVPLGVISVVLFGILAGQMTYRWRRDIILTSIITVALSFLGIWISTLNPVQNIFCALYGTLGGKESPIMFLSVTRAQFIGTLIVMAICYIGAVLPIWQFAQPINYVAFWIVFLGIFAGMIGLIIWHPGMGDFPAFTQWDVPGLGSLWPILFVTIACGAISGWHSLVSSAGSARQIEKETDALFVGGGAMFLEMFFAVMAFLTATVAFGSFEGYKKAGSVLDVFAVGLARFMSHVGISETFGEAYGRVFLVLMGLTIMYLVVRFMRVASSEALGEHIPILKNIHIGSIIAIILTLILIWFVPFLKIWVIFGAANQLMASLALLLITVWLMSKSKKHNWTFIPFVFMFITTIAALIYKAIESFRGLTGVDAMTFIANLIIGVVSLFLIVASAILAYDALKAINSYRNAEHKKA